MSVVAIRGQGKETTFTTARTEPVTRSVRLSTPPNGKSRSMSTSSADPAGLDCDFPPLALEKVKGSVEEDSLPPITPTSASSSVFSVPGMNVASDIADPATDATLLAPKPSVAEFNPTGELPTARHVGPGAARPGPDFTPAAPRATPANLRMTGFRRIEESPLAAASPLSFEVLETAFAWQSHLLCPQTRTLAVHLGADTAEPEIEVVLHDLDITAALAPGAISGATTRRSTLSGGDTLTLRRSSSGYGFQFCMGDFGAVVTDVTVDGDAALAGLAVAAVIGRVNGTSIAGLPKIEVIKLLKSRTRMSAVLELAVCTSGIDGVDQSSTPA